jgi:hypothetical protein
VTAGATGSGPGSVAYTVSANQGAESRTGSLAIGDQRHSLTQQGRTPPTCSYDVSPGSADFGKDSSSGTFTVTAPAGCSWTATTSASWLTITAGSQGSGNGAVTYDVTRNTEIAERSGAILVANRRFAVRQSGDAGICQYSVTPVEARPCLTGGSVTVTLTTQPACPWTASANVPWLTVPAGAGNGSAVFPVTFSNNYEAPRAGIVMVRWPTPTAGQNIHVAQAGCLYAVSKSAFDFLATGGSGTFDVIQQSDPITCGSATQDRCVWSAVSSVAWITVTSSMPRAGDNPVAFVIAPNDSASLRTGTITVRDKVVTVTQAGK